MLTAAVTSGAALSDDDAALELHHIVIAGFIVFAELGSIVQQLTEHPDVRTKVAAEVAAIAPNGPLSLETLMAMPYLLQVVNEVKRLCPIVPAVFGKTKKALEFDGVSVPAGWMVMWAVTPSHVAQSLYTNPTAFDPDRFSPERAEDKRHEHAFAPQGPGRRPDIVARGSTSPRTSWRSSRSCFFAAICGKYRRRTSRWISARRRRNRRMRCGRR